MAVIERELRPPALAPQCRVPLAAQSVAIIAFPGIVLVDAAQTLEVLAAARRAVAPAPGYDVLVTSPTGCSVPTSCGVRLGVDAAMREVIGTVDTLIVLGGWDYDATFANPGVLPHIRRLGDTARRVTGICNGAHLLQAAGLLEPQRRSRTRVARSGTELSMWLVDQDYGSAVVSKVTGWLRDWPARERDSDQTSGSDSLTIAPDSSLRRVADAVLSDPAADHSVTNLARLACISDRHLTRLFRSEMGMGPARFVQRVRVEEARASLEHNNKTIEVIAAECGFGTAETMRRAFLRVLGVSPSAYRSRSTGCTQC